ncbi:MAG: aminotransferase class V-fold PLP-dependent enzyme [Deltaproteobacteria bacterium]|nr:aminotransferase class V-fold PLP-dependent enzyme [Deltaproteobacteria bacterium]
MIIPNRFRDEFPIFKNKIHLDVAFKCAPSDRVLQAMTEFILDLQRTGGDKPEWFQMADTARTVIGRLIHARPDDIAFIKNTTEGLNMVACGVQPWLNRQRFGVDIRWVKSRNGRVLTEDIESMIDDRTRIVSISSVQYISGFRVDLKQIGEMCRSRDILFVVDAVQHLGVLPVDVKSSCIDVLSCGGHKFLLCPPVGIGVLYVGESCRDKIAPAFVGLNQVNKVVDSGGGNGGKEILFGTDAGKFEYGYFNFVGIAGLMASVTMLLEAGLENIEQHVMALNIELADRLKHHGAELITPLGETERSAIVVMKLKNWVKVLEIMERENIIVTIRDGNMRISFHYYNISQDFDALIECLIRAGEIDR